MWFCQRSSSILMQAIISLACIRKGYLLQYSHNVHNVMRIGTIKGPLWKPFLFTWNQTKHGWSNPSTAVLQWISGGCKTYYLTYILQVLFCRTKVKESQCFSSNTLWPTQLDVSLHKHPHTHAARRHICLTTRRGCRAGLVSHVFCHSLIMSCFSVSLVSTSNALTHFCPMPSSALNFLFKHGFCSAL